MALKLNRFSNNYTQIANIEPGTKVKVKPFSDTGVVEAKRSNGKVLVKFQGGGNSIVVKESDCVIQNSLSGPFSINEFKDGKFIKMWGSKFPSVQSAEKEILILQQGVSDVSGITFNIESDSGTVAKVIKNSFSNGRAKAQQEIANKWPVLNAERM